MNFDQISQKWQNQHKIKDNSTAEEIMSKARIQTQNLKHKKWWTIAILSLTVFILIAFYINVGAYNNWAESLGLSVMIIALLLRTLLEIISKHQLEKIDKTLDFQTYVEQHQRYYKNRQWIHFIFTPIIYFVYFGGFVSMLPVFKAELSSGFYLYILISGVVVFIGLAVFISFHIKKELKALRFLKEVVDN